MESLPFFLLVLVRLVVVTFVFFRIVVWVMTVQNSRVRPPENDERTLVMPVDPDSVLEQLACILAGL